MAIVLEQKWAPFIVLACKGKNKEPDSEMLNTVEDRSET